MSNLVIALLFAIGAGGWIFAKMQRQSGGATKQSLLVASLGAGLLFILVLLVLHSIFKG